MWSGSGRSSSILTPESTCQSSRASRTGTSHRNRHRSHQKGGNRWHSPRSRGNTVRSCDPRSSYSTCSGRHAHQHLARSWQQGGPRSLRFFGSSRASRASRCHHYCYARTPTTRHCSRYYKGSASSSSRSEGCPRKRRGREGRSCEGHSSERRRRKRRSFEGRSYCHSRAGRLRLGRRFCRRSSAIRYGLRRTANSRSRRGPGWRSRARPRCRTRSRGYWWPITRRDERSE